MSALDLDELESLLAAVSVDNPPPWVASEKVAPDWTHGRVHCARNRLVCEPGYRVNAKLIAAAVTALPELLDVARSAAASAALSSLRREALVALLDCIDRDDIGAGCKARGMARVALEGDTADAELAALRTKADAFDRIREECGALVEAYERLTGQCETAAGADLFLAATDRDRTLRRIASKLSTLLATKGD